MTSSPTTKAPHRFCIVNCYPAASRENFDRSNVGHPHDMFKDFLAREAPNATTELVYVADPDFALPPGTSIADFDGLHFATNQIIFPEHRTVSLFIS